MSLDFWKKRAPKPPTRCDLRVAVTADGRAVSGALVRIGMSGNLTGPDGVAIFSLAPSVSATVTVSAAGFGTYGGAYQLVAGAQTIPIGLQRNAHVRNPIVGRLRIDNKVFVDETGPRRLIGCSWFSALRVFADDRPQAEAQLDVIAESGYQIVACMAYLGRYCNNLDSEAAKGDVFYGLEVGFDHGLAQIGAFLKACQDRGLSVHLMGDKDQAADAQLIGYWADLANQLRATGLESVVALVTCFNEATLYMSGDEAHTITVSQGIMDAIRSRLYPAPLCTIGSFNDDNPNQIQKSGTGADFYDIHDTMLPAESAIKRIFGRFYNEGTPRAFPKPFIGPEPHGPGAGSSHRIEDPDWLLGEHAMYALTGAPSYYFCGDSAFYRNPLEGSLLFRTLPTLLANIPDGISRWKQGPGGGWWFSDGSQFATLDVEGWGCEQRAPIASWQIVTANGVTAGVGDLPKATPGYKCRLLMGRYA